MARKTSSPAPAPQTPAPLPSDPIAREAAIMQRAYELLEAAQDARGIARRAALAKGEAWTPTPLPGWAHFLKLAEEQLVAEAASAPAAPIAESPATQPAN